MIVPPKPIDLTKRTPQELKNLLENNKKNGKTEMVHAVLAEMTRRRMATRRDYQSVTWNQDRVREVMQPFQEIASKVKNNQRTSYTEAGGLRIGRPKNDPEWRWIDSYSAIKTDKINAVFVCYVEGVDDEPKFELHVDDTLERFFIADQIPDALKDWQAIADRQQ